MSIPANNATDKDDAVDIVFVRKRKHNLEQFMIAVAKEVGCLPDFFDSLPDIGNAHIMRRLRELTAAEHSKPAAMAGALETRAPQIKSDLFTAIANVANGQACQAQVYRAAMIAWQGGLLTDAEFNGVGKTLIAVERER